MLADDTCLVYDTLMICVWLADTCLVYVGDDMNVLTRHVNERLKFGICLVFKPMQMQLYANFE